MISKTNKSILIFLVFAFAFFISNLLRSITATLSPVLTSVFNLTAGNLGLLAGGYFLGFTSMQIPLGFLLDKHGPRKIVSSLLIIAIVGTTSFALAQNFASLLISRVFIGIGVSACMMGPLTGYRIWFEEKYQQRANSWMLMVANIGFVFSTLPVQFLLPIIGWRWIFFGTTFLIISLIVLILLFIPNTKKKFKKDENEIEVKLSYIWKNKFFISVIPLGFFNYGGMYAIQTLWAGPWMIRVTGYSSLESATGLFWINFTALIGFFLWGYFLPIISKYGLNSFKLMKFGLPISYLVLLSIIIKGSNAGAFLFTIYILTSIVLTVVQPAVGLSFPKRLAGKSLTSYNLVIFLGTFIMQWGMGLIIDFSHSMGKSEILSFQISFFVYFILCIFSYIFFVLKSKKHQKDI